MDIKFLNTHNLLTKYCQNSRNSIEDPIFTGFTFDIDKLHSPLFYSLCEQEFTDSLRSPDGTNTEIAKSIENKLNQVNAIDILGNPSTYEILTIDTKNPFGTDNRRRPGYGLWDKHYIDNVLYGAADYIYMVDKVSIGTYTDDFGVTDLGNGTPDRSILDDYSDILNSFKNEQDILFGNDEDFISPSENTKINELVESMNNQPDSSIQLTGYASEVGTSQHNIDLSKRRVETVRDALISNGIESSRIATDYKGETSQFSPQPDPNRVVKCKIGSEAAAIDMQIAKEKEEMQELETAHENKKKDVEALKETYQKEIEEYAKLKKEIENEKNSIESETLDIKQSLNDYKSTLSSNTDKLKTTVDDSVLNDVKNSINNVWAEFVSLVEGTDSMYNSPSGEKKEVNKKSTTATFKLPSLKDLENEEKSLKKEINKDDLDSYIKKIAFVTKANIENIKSANSANDIINKKNEDLRKKENDIFGTHPDGTIGSENNPAPNSLCYNYLQAKKELENDDYTKKEYRINDLQNTKDNISTIEDYQNRDVNSVTRNSSLPSSDYVDPQTRNTRELFEIPQTVYDMLGFTRDMKKLINETPYVFQSITGLDEAYNKYFEIKDPYMGSGDDKISIECMEFLDLRVTSMFNKYFNAAYDRQYRRERVPINLRRFNCSIFVHDIRNFKNSINNPNVEDSGDLFPIAEFALNYVSAIEFKFFDCEIVPNETGGLFDSVSNLPNNEARKTKFTFTYGNCVINFLPFEDLRKYVLNKNFNEIKPGEISNYQSLKDSLSNSSWGDRKNTVGIDGNFRRWFDKSVLGNVNNNDYRDYIRRDASVAVDDHYKTTVVNNFALGSVSQKNQELTAMDDALRKIVTGISASTGIPPKKAADALNIGNIYGYLNDKEKATVVTKNLGNAMNSKVVDIDTMEYIGKVEGEEEKERKTTKDLGNVHNN